MSYLAKTYLEKLHQEAGSSYDEALVKGTVPDHIRFMSAPASDSSSNNPTPHPSPDNTKETKIKIKDTRKVDAATGKLLGEYNRMDADVDPGLVRMIVDSANKHGVDPATALSIGLNETGLSLPKVQPVGNTKYAPLVNSDPYKRANPFMVGGTDELPGKDIAEEREKNGDIDTFFKIFNERLKTGKRLGKKDEASLIQAYNGYGKINKGTLYGINTEESPIDFNENPVYGKRILDIRDNIIKNNPELMAMIANPPQQKQVSTDNSGTAAKTDYFSIPTLPKK
jgi:hypothetical protein